MASIGNLSIAVALGVINSVGSYTDIDFDALGVTQEDYDLCTGSAHWKREHRNRVQATIEKLLFGTTDVLGLPRINVPAEYVASVLSVYVQPCNRALACIWLAERRNTGAPALEMVAAGVSASKVDNVSWDQLFALCIALSDNSASSAARTQFESRMNKAIEGAINA